MFYLATNVHPLNGSVFKIGGFFFDRQEPWKGFSISGLDGIKDSPGG